MEEPFQPYSDSLQSFTWKEDDDTVHLRCKKEKSSKKSAFVILAVQSARIL